MIKISSFVEIDALEIVDGASNQEDVLNLIKEIDEHMQDWSFTEELYQHFAKLHEKYLEEQKESND